MERNLRQTKKKRFQKNIYFILIDLIICRKRKKESYRVGTKSSNYFSKYQYIRFKSKDVQKLFEKL